MSNAFNTAITGGADGIAVRSSATRPSTRAIDSALKAKIPVVSYNADAPNSGRLAYIGQDLFVSGAEMGKRIRISSPPATSRCSSRRPAANIQPR